MSYATEEGCNSQVKNQSLDKDFIFSKDPDDQHHKYTVEVNKKTKTNFRSPVIDKKLKLLK